MSFPRLLFPLGALSLLVASGFVAYFYRGEISTWMSSHPSDSARTRVGKQAPVQDAKLLKLTETARKNLGLVAKPMKPRSFWRSIQIPGQIADRPGWSDRGVTSPAVGVVTEIHAFPGDTVHSGESLFTLRLFSEYLQNTQAELFRAIRESQLIESQRTRIASAATSGAISESKLIELDNQAKRQGAAIQGYRQDLLTRGLTPIQIDEVAEGRFVSTISVVAPAAAKSGLTLTTFSSANSIKQDTGLNQGVFEVQDLQVELGQQVQAGQLLSTLSNHESLYLEGHAFKSDASLISKAAENNWPIEAEFSDDTGTEWPVNNQPLFIRHLANSIDPVSRTFSFFVPLANPSRSYQKNGQKFIVWRYRPGQRVRLHVPVEEMTNVFVLPSAAVVREGSETFLFQQNGDLFNRISAHLLYQDRLYVVLANDGSLTPGLYVAQSSAAALNRILKAQAASGLRADVHVHADGTVHAAH